MEDFGKLCRQLRKQMKMSQDKVAEKAGVTSRRVSEIESGNSVSWLTLEAVLGVFGYELKVVKADGEEE